MSLGIATNRGKSMQAILDHFEMGRFFSVVVTSKDVQRPKPHPDMLLLAASHLNLAPETLVFVGDSELDEHAALTAGMKFVGFGADAPGEVVVGSHREFLEWVLETNGGI
jgi:HAD superfamily hydrolase (TIGR01509 family)